MHLPEETFTSDTEGKVQGLIIGTAVLPIEPDFHTKSPPLI